MKESSRKSAASKLLGFIKPYSVTYGLSMTVYSTQQFCANLLISATISGFSGAIISGSTNDVFSFLLRVISIMVAYFFVLAVGVNIYVLTIEKITRDIKLQVFRSFIHASTEKPASSHSGDSIAALNTDVSRAGELYSHAAFEFLACISSIVFTAIVIFAVDWRLGLVSLAAGAVAFIVQSRFAKPISKIGTETLENNAKTVKTFTNVFSGGASIKAFGLEHKVFTEFDTDSLKMLALSYKSAIISMLQSLFTTVQGWISMAGIFGIGGYLVATNKLSFESLMLVPGLSIALANGLSGLGSAWAGLQYPLAACKRIEPLLKKVEPSPKRKVGAEKFFLKNNDIHINNLTFTYRDNELPTLKDITLDIPGNKTYAFVGKSGCGKSTLLRSIIGMYDRDDMNIIIGSVCFNDVNASDWRKNFAYVDQSCKLFDMSIKENISLGNIGCTFDDVKKASVLAGAENFIKELPDGYDTLCGEKGSFLSGGQKQRIAIARALVRNAPVLVFDEVTSALDNESGRLVTETIRNLQGRNTILIVTHNLKEVEYADCIIVLEEGRIVASGTHEQLLGQSEVYKSLLRE